MQRRPTLQVALTRAELEDALRPFEASPSPFPSAADRSAWDAVRARLADGQVAEVLEHAEQAARSPIPPLPATLYLDCARTGQREAYESALRERHRRLATLALAECLEGRGRFLDPVLDAVWATCEESSWAWPAHQRRLADPRRPSIDLIAASTALYLAEIDALLGSLVDPALGVRIRYEVDRRCLSPYLERPEDWWWLFNAQLGANWAAVCNAGVVGAALYLERDAGRLATLVERALESLETYIAAFDPDGGTSEGPGYWSYGFSAFTLLAHLLEWRTRDAIRLLEDPRMRTIARFPLRTPLSPGHHVTFSDSRASVAFQAPHLAYLARYFEVPELMALASAQDHQAVSADFGWSLRGLLWPVDREVSAYPVPSPHDWWPGLEWMIARCAPADPAALVVAAKGGHNREMHNHNDVGALIVHYAGESLITDLGPGRYTEAYFSERRFEHPATSSLGHAVPVPNGQPQPYGREYAAQVVEHHASPSVDRLVLELKSAYPAEADLNALRRTIALHREGALGWVEVRDAARFATRPGTLETVLVTLGQATVGAARVAIRGQHAALSVQFDPEAVAARVELLPNVDLAAGPRDVQRIIFALRTPVLNGQIALRIDPRP